MSKITTEKKFIANITPEHNTLLLNIASLYGLE